MQSFAVIHLLDEMRNALDDIVVGFVVRQMHFLVLYGFEERFHVGVVARPPK
jgi:hypothetical protein